MQTDPVLPFWLVGPLAAVVLVIIAGHLMAMRSAKAEIPASRYRIRNMNAGVMLAAVPLLACAFGVVSPDDRKFFALIWMTCVGLLGIVVVLAVVDGLNNLRLARREAAALMAEHRSLMAEAAMEMRRLRGVGSGSRGDETHE